MIRQVANYLIFGKPLVMYVGIVTLLTFGLTALIAVMNNRGDQRLPFSWHQKAAKVALLIATVHAILAVSLFF
jgi:hypothetical protein